jgi:hypothetical protein
MQKGVEFLQDILPVPTASLDCLGLAFDNQRWRLDQRNHSTLFQEARAMISGKIKVAAIMGLTAGVLGAGIAAQCLSAAPGVPQIEKSAKPDVPVKGEAGGTDPFKGQLSWLQFEQTQRELAQMQADLRKTRAELAFWEARDERIAKLTIPDSAIEERMNLDPTVVKHLNRIAELKNLIAEAEGVAVAGKSSEVVKEYRDQIAATEKILGSLRPMLRAQITKQLREKAYDEFKGRIVQFKEQIEFWEGFEKVLKTDLKRLAEESKGASNTGPTDARVGALEKEVRDLKEAVAELKKKR